MKKVLFIGAHPDDIELGCGGTIHKHLNDWDMHCLVLCRCAFGNIDITDQQKEAFKTLGITSFQLFDFSPSLFPPSSQGIWEVIKRCSDWFRPDTVFTHAPDSQQDHVTTYEQSRRIFFSESLIKYHAIRSSQNHMINYYEILSQEDVEYKLKSLQCYDCYKDKFYFRESLLKSQLEFYGGFIQSSAAEGFEIEKLIVT